MSIVTDAQQIMDSAIASVLPDVGVKEALSRLPLQKGRIVVLSVGKGGYTMAKASEEVLGDRISDGLVITKYDHMKSDIPHFKAIEAGHPTPDENSFRASGEALRMVENLTEDDQVIFLLSGGASALFEKPMIPFPEMQRITKALLACGADIYEINTVRKHLSLVKGGRFAEAASPAKVDTIVLSDVLGNELSVVGSGPTAEDPSTSEEAIHILQKYHIEVSPEVMAALSVETPKHLSGVTFHCIGDVRILCESARAKAEELGYRTEILTDYLTAEARDTGSIFASIARTRKDTKENIAFIMGGESVVHLTGNGKGGRNQEMALAAAIGLQGLSSVCFFSLGSDGTDGPTDAAGGIVTGDTFKRLKEAGFDPEAYLANNDAYTALKAVDGLIMTGPTGTNVNDVSVLLMKGAVE